MQIMPGCSDPYGEIVLFSQVMVALGNCWNPETNIDIGTSYLQYVYQQFGNNRILPQQLITPTRAGANLAWQQRRAYRRSGICREYPFSETRGYVKNVLAYDAYYRYFMGDQPTLMSTTEWGRDY
ncbi:transglycosylase SLT domain-containing protein [Escherichia coli]